ncbi:hypothetical protein [Frankia sp. R43]|uniref:hypothetical protein n=1 Tax=Frankia sp. R43 TaxID=269536 RepID=UPI0019105E2A|nr:hypothetical protein [Frankia sp. R43]
MLWVAFAVSITGTIAGAKILDLDGAQGKAVSYGSIALSLLVGSLLARREPLKSLLRSTRVQWFLFLFNGGIAVGSYFFVDGNKGTGLAVGMGLVALGAGIGLLKHPNRSAARPE